MPIQFRNVKEPPITLGVAFGVLGKRIIAPDAFVTVTDDAAPAYERQPLVWRRDGVPAPAKEEAPAAPEVVTETGDTAHTDAEPVAVQTEPETAPVQDTSATEAQEALLDKEIAELEAERAALAHTEGS